MLQNHGEYASLLTSTDSLGSLGWMYFHMGSSSGSSRNLDTTTLLFERKDLVGGTFIAKVSEAGNWAGKQDISGCPL